MPEVKQAFDRAGILVRWPGAVKDCLRLTVGAEAENRAVLKVFTGLFQLAGLDLPDVVLPAAAQTRGRTAHVSRKTRETQIDLVVDLDGGGSYELDSGVPFLDHMLAQIAVHGLFDLNLAARGDLEIDPHHTVEDVGLALGEAFRQALGDKKGIVRAASSDVPMDESLARVVVDFSGRPYAVVQVNWNGPQLGGLPVSLIAHFLESFAIQARCNLHVQVFYGRDDHHQCEAIFKALARALDAATRLDPRRAQGVPSSKGVLF